MHNIDENFAAQVPGFEHAQTGWPFEIYYCGLQTGIKASRSEFDMEMISKHLILCSDPFRKRSRYNVKKRTVTKYVEVQFTSGLIFLTL